MELEALEQYKLSKCFQALSKERMLMSLTVYIPTDSTEEARDHAHDCLLHIIERVGNAGNQDSGDGRYCHPIFLPAESVRTVKGMSTVRNYGLGRSRSPMRTPDLVCVRSLVLLLVTQWLIVVSLV